MIKNIQRSLVDILGESYISAVCRARALLSGKNYDELMAIANEKVDFYPADFAARQEELMDLVGQQVIPAFETAENGAPIASYGAAQHNDMAPLGGQGAFRLGESGKLYFTGKSEHYQIPLGHQFPGYALIEKAKALGILNATHNNTRGFITRTAERRLVACANNLDPADPKLDEIIGKKEPGVISGVINLETGSLACEAALKMMLSRFYGLDNNPVKYEGKIPVFLIMADNAGGITGNYHGTTIFAQTLRGMWPKFYAAAQEHELYKVVSVPINDAEGFRKIMEQYNTGDYKTAGFCHEIILMNYGGIRLQESYLHEAYRLCREYDTPVLCDEIQSCAWYDGCFLFKKYGLTPDFVSVGKGFPGGEYPASKVITTAEYGNLNQFGALVTNGQEELASLAYLITMTFALANREKIAEIGDYFEARLNELCAKYPEKLTQIEGAGLLAALHCKDIDSAKAFMNALHDACIDASAQIYKQNCLPAVLFKPSLISDTDALDFIANAIDGILAK